MAEKEQAPKGQTKVKVARPQALTAAEAERIGLDPAPYGKAAK